MGPRPYLECTKHVVVNFWRNTVIINRKMDDYEYTVYTTWQISFERLKTHAAQAAEFLQHCAYFAPKWIPRQFSRMLLFNIDCSVTRTELVWKTQKISGWFLTSGTWDTRKFMNIVSEIRSYSRLTLIICTNVLPYIHSFMTGTRHHLHVSRSRMRAVYIGHVGQLWSLRSEH